MEENEPQQRRPRTSDPAFSTPEQPAPRAKPAKTPPPVTFRPPAADKTPGGDADTPARRGPARATPRKAADESPSTRSRTQAAAKSQPPRVGADADTTPPAQPAKAPAKRQPRKITEPPAGKTTKATPTRTAEPTPAKAAKSTPTKADPAKAVGPAHAKATPAKATEPAASPKPARATPAKATRPPVKKAAATVKAVAAELAPAIVTPDLTTVPDEPPQPPVTPAPAVPEKDLPRAVASVADVAEALSGVRTEAWAALVADPGHTPELLALAATQTVGPRAREWAARTRAAYPGAGPDALARLAVHQFTRFGSVSSVFAAVAGSYAPVALLGAAAFTQAELALHVAAAYGLDPTDRARAVDLLVLCRVHPVREDAEAALAAAEQHSHERTGLTDATWRLGRMLAAQAGGWAVVRLANRFFPGTGLLVAALTSRGAAEAMASRATVLYRGQSQSSQEAGSRV